MANIQLERVYANETFLTNQKSLQQALIRVKRMGLLVMLMGYWSTLKSRCVNVSGQKIKKANIYIYIYIYKRVNSEPIKRNRQSRISSCLLLKKLASFTKKALV